MKKIIDFVTKNPVVITIIICFLFYFLPFKPMPFGDGEYHEGTIQLIDFVLNGFHGNVRIDKGLFTLFYYFIPYSFAYVFHNNTVYYFFGIIFNCIVICFGINYLFKAFNLSFFLEKSKFWTVLLINLFPIHIYYAMGILAETPSFFAVCILVYTWVKISYSKSYSIYHLLSLVFSIVMLVGCRPNLFPFALLILFYFLTLKVNLNHKLIFLGSFISVMTIITICERKGSSRNDNFKKEVFRKQLLWSRFELRDEPFNWLPQHGQDQFSSSDYLNNLSKRRELDSICETNHLDKTVYYVNWVKNDIINNPILTLRQYVLKFFQSQSFIISPLMKSNINNSIKYGIHFYINSINFLLIFLSIFSIYLLIKEKEYQLLIPFIMLWSWSLIYVFIFHSEQRYMFPNRPILIFLFAYFVNHISRKANTVDCSKKSNQI